MAQEPTPIPQPTVDPILKAAQDEAALAKARADKAESEKKEAEAERDKLKATAQPFGTPSITAPDGKVTTDASGFVETQMLGQEAARLVTARLAAEVTSQGNIKKIVIYNSGDITALTAYMSVVEQLKVFNQEFAKQSLQRPDDDSTPASRIRKSADLFLRKPDDEVLGDISLASAAPAIATGAVKSVAELAQLFRSTTDFKNKTIPVTKETVISYLINNVGTVKVYHPAMFPPLIFNSTEKTEFIIAFNDLQRNKSRSQSDIAELDRLTTGITKIVADAKAELAKAAQDATVDKPKMEERISNGERFLRRLAEIKTQIQFLLAAGDQVINGLLAPDATTKVTPLAQMARIAHLQSLLKETDTYTLNFDITANGTTKTKQWLFFDAKIRHSAGASLAYQLFDKEGAIVKANSFQFYFDWKSAKEVRACLDAPCLLEKEKTTFRQ